MKLPFPRHSISRASSGAILEEGDAIVQLPGVIMPTMVVGTPVDFAGAVAAATTVSQSFSFSSTQQISGILATADFPTPIFGRGAWHLQLQLITQFKGTDDNTDSLNVFMTTRDGSTINWTIFFFATITPLIDSSVRDLWLIIPDDGHRIVVRTPTTQVGDQLSFSLSLLANKLW